MTLPLHCSPEEPEDELVSPHQPFEQGGPLPGVKNPVAYVFEELEKHRNGSSRCCRPMKHAPTPEPEVDPLPGREAQGRLAVLPVSEWPLLIEEERYVRRKKWRRKGELKARV